jgi:hypothetical protein
MRLSLIALTLLCLAGCAANEATRTYSYTPPPTPGGRLCSDQCQQAREYCHQTCDLKNRACYGNEQAEALREYDQYVRAQFLKHGGLDLLPHDFERPGPCQAENKTCYDNCESQYSVCYQNCGGKVSVTTSCRFLCF